jgi:hypothetical protein
MIKDPVPELSKSGKSGMLTPATSFIVEGSKNRMLLSRGSKSGNNA